MERFTSGDGGLIRAGDELGDDGLRVGSRAFETRSS
jgi:hypothetical protein